jgi:predicted dehydrogenase
MLNTAIVGLGWWGKTLVKSARDFGAPLRVLRGITLEPETVRDFAAEHQIALGTSLDEVLADKSIQAVILATPHTKHRAQVEAIAAAGKHIYCEKPFALSKADAQAALDACRRAGIVIAVGHHFRRCASLPNSRRKVPSALSCMRKATTVTIGSRAIRPTVGAFVQRKAGLVA